MPLTLAHPAVVIPLRRWLVLSALVIGSMAPDFSKIFSLARDVTLGHTLPGVFWFCVPVSLLLFIIFQHGLKKPLFLLLPANHQKRLVPYLPPFPLHTTKDWGLVIGSIIIAALTHLFWDAFTHKHGWFVETFPILERNLFTVRHHRFEIYVFLQAASTVGGLILLALYYFRFYQKAATHPLPSIRLFSTKVKCIVVGSLFLTSVLVGIIFANAHPYPMIDWETLAGRAAVAFIAAFCAELMLYCIACHFYLKNSPYSSPS